MLNRLYPCRGEEFWLVRAKRDGGMGERERSVNMNSTALLTQGQQHLCYCALLYAHTRTYMYLYALYLIIDRGEVQGEKWEEQVRRETSFVPSLSLSLTRGSYAV